MHFPDPKIYEKHLSRLIFVDISVSQRSSTRQCIIKHWWTEENHVSIKHINPYRLLPVTASIIKYTSILILSGFLELINSLLNLQTTYAIATKKSYQKSNLSAYLFDKFVIKMRSYEISYLLIQWKSQMCIRQNNQW